MPKTKEVKKESEETNKLLFNEVFKILNNILNANLISCANMEIVSKRLVQLEEKVNLLEAKQ